MNKYHLKCSKYINYLPTYLPNDDDYIFLLKQTGQVGYNKRKKIVSPNNQVYKLMRVYKQQIAKEKKEKSIYKIFYSENEFTCFVRQCFRCGNCLPRTEYKYVRLIPMKNEKSS